MGKLLLKSNNNNNKSTNKQSTLTEEPFANLFRVRKNKLQDSNDDAKFTFKYLPDDDKKENRLSDGKKTRWDVGQEEEQKKDEVTQKEEPSLEEQEEDPIDLFDDDSESLTSLDTLQSDDDVLGPWMNLASDKKEQECESCIQLNDKDRDPMDAAHCCSTCTDQWKTLLGDLLEKIQSLAVNASAGKKKRVKLDKSIQEQPSTKKEKQPQQRTRGKKSVIPPTQSRHSQSTNKKMETFVSTGAFMTRKTAETLADPENGFYPNPYGYAHLQVVEVLNINGIWYRGTLEKMDKGKVKVKYSDWDDQEWIIMGSRRLRIVPPDVIAKERDEEKKEKDSSKDTLTVIPRAKGRDDDYVSSTLDKDPQQLFNDNEVFITRRMARAMVDEYGFRPNSFGYRRNRAVAVVFNVKNKECIGFLREMRDNQVRVWYPDLYQSEWIRVGSRRLRLLSSEEEEKYKQQVDLDVQEVPAVIEQKKAEDEPKEATPKESTSEPKTKKLRQKKAKSKAPTPEPETHQEKQQQKEPQRPVESSFLTTGAFATRRAMRQLQDENGFVPNPYNYTYNQPVEILNTRSGKTHFWECGRLVAMRPGQVKVHYDGWDEAYDEWVMVGSRRIRILSKEEEENKKKHNELLVAEANPEVQDEVKRKRKHQVIRPEDYAKLGLLESEQTVIKQKKKVSKEVTPVESDSSSSEEDEEEYEEPSVRRRSRKAGKNKKKKAVKQKQQLQQQKIAEYSTTTTGAEEEKQIISLRVAQAKASEKYEFVANVYGYDYMQHVTVLNLDKKMYEARLVSMHKNKVKVHYCGWPDIFDEYITVGSRRIQPIENDHQVECIEPDYQERYEKVMQDGPTECQHQHQPAPKKLNRKRLTLDDVQEEEGQGEYHKEPNEEEEDIEVVEMDSWKVYCNQCNVVIKQFRYYCTYCENPSIGYDYRSFELCLRCFDQNFPFWHEHPRSSFAIQAVIDAEAGPRPIKGELVTVWEEDVLEEEHQQEEQDASSIFTGETAIEGDQGYRFLKRWKRRKVCAFCNDDDDTSEDLGSFIGPFIIATYNKNGVEKKRSFWAHDACARYSPEVFCTPEGKWYNVTLALRRGRGMRCYVCKEKGATIGCFESKCSKSFHLPCSQKPVSYFKSGVIFWCSVHEAYYNKKDTYVNVFNCDGCGKKMEEESWFTCVPCSSSSYFSSFDLCNECFEKFPKDHPHNEDDFEETSLAIIKEMEAQKAREAARKKEEAREANAKKKLLFPRKRRKLPDGSAPVSCCYCGTAEAESWRKAYDGGVMMCNPCFELALMVDNDERPTSDMPLVIHNAEQQYMTSIEDYSHKPYFTREAAIKIDSETAVIGQRLTSYEPQPNQLFSLAFESTYFDIPGRAPRWATHSGTDYHGTWLPQTVRRAILKHTTKDERVLSNFLGRGTDAIECFLLQRRCIGVDINPAAISLSQRNCAFEVPPGLTSAEYRPIIAQADSRQLTGALFTDESFHHILSHPPYKDCVTYSTHLDGDLSRFTSVEEFNKEYAKVVSESWRLLKMSRRLTLGIGDNREHCFYIPVGYHMFRLYIDEGFELEELIIKRQRYCSAFGLGTYLCVQFDFLVFTHEFICTFRKIPKENIDRMLINEEDQHRIPIKRTLRGVPSSAIMRKSVVMGTVWVFKPTDSFRFDQLCISRMVERFGKDDGNWEHIELDLEEPHQKQQSVKPAELEKGNETNEEQEEISDYERQRLKRIEENNKTLLKLGLISELSEKSDDIIHYENMMSKSPYVESDLVLMIVGHQQILPRYINSYRQTLVDIAKEAIQRLAPKGMLIIGAQDIRDPVSGKLWPMSMLILEDIERAVGRDDIRLKELVVTVPDGYSKDRQQKPRSEEEEDEMIDIETIDDFVPIVHAVYLIFQKL
ncbi:hypothetical protein RMCBS344292_14260 [Rhizopus microsporus]|nr:hypothetical protein RMCBS344292_14260 [Rhizopus microsporus]CEJ00196.1 hypothetical protein RMCBS344292_14260 [Rhizopus microsporus]CEJ00197.1 hypothetical protein RMCBS344292_14260 [Rhizopus microsporus]